MNGEADVVCFEDTASSIVNDAWFQNRQAKGEDETRCIVKTAAKIIASELRSLTYSTVAYPTEKVISDLNANKDWLPDHFRIFMETLVKDPLHQVSLGLSMNYSEVTRFKYSVLVNDDSKKLLKEVATGVFSLWSTDNVDHNICSLNGRGSLHEIGMIISTTGATLRRRSPVKREKILNSSEIVKRLSKTDR